MGMVGEAICGKKEEKKCFNEKIVLQKKIFLKKKDRCEAFGKRKKNLTSQKHIFEKQKRIKVNVNKKGKKDLENCLKKR